MTDTRSNMMVGSGDVFNYRLISKIKQGKLDEIEPFFNALALDVGNDPRVFPTNFIDELNDEPVIEYYSKKDKAAFRDQLRAWLYSALHQRVNSLIESEKTRDKLDRAISDIKAICKQTKLLQGRGGLLGLSDKKKDLQGIESLVNDLQKKIETTPFNDGSENREMLNAAASGDLERVKQGIASGLNINAVLSDGRGLLYLAAEAKHYPVVDYLIQAGAEVNLPLRNFCTVLHYAAMWGDLTLTKKLIDAKANLDKVGYPAVNSVTPLFMALEHKNPEIVKALIDAGANFNLPKINPNKRNYQTMPLSYAICHSDQATIDLLLTTMVNEANKYFEEPTHLLDVSHDESIYSKLIWAFREFNCEKVISADTKAARKLRTNLRRTLCDALGKKIDRLIAEKVLSRLDAESDGLGQVMRDLYFIRRDGERLNALYTGRPEKKKTAMIKIEAYDYRLLLPRMTLRQNPPTPNDELINAAMSGNVDLAAYWLSQGADVSYVNKYGQTPLYFAIVKNQIDMVRFLVTKNPYMAYCLGEQNGLGEDRPALTYLNLAVRHGMIEIAEILLEANSDYDINELTPAGATHLIYAAQDGQTEMVKFLIERGADINLAVQNNKQTQETPLGQACKFYQYNTANVIIEALHEKISSLIPGEGNYAALINYLNGEEKNYQGSRRLKKVLRKRLSTALTEHVNALMAGSTIDSLKAEKEGLSRLSKQVNLLQGKGGLGKLSDKKKDLIKIEALINELESKIQTLESALDTSIGAPLSQAAADGDLEKVKTILGQNIPINSLNRFGHTALRRAAGFGKIEVVEYLIQQKADVNIACECGYSPLHAASQEGYSDIAERLIAAGASVDNPVKVGALTSLQLASGQGHLAVAELLIKNGAAINAKEGGTGCTALYFAAEQGKLEVVKCLIAAGADLNIAGDDGRTPLYGALLKSHWEVVACLVEAGANVNCATASSDWPTVFERASHKGRQDIVALFKDALEKKIRSFVPGCVEAGKLAAGTFDPLIEYLNGEAKHYRRSKFIRQTMRQCLVAALRETVLPIARDGDKATKNAVASGLEQMMDQLDIIKKVGLDIKQKTAMGKIKRLSKLLRKDIDLTVSQAGMYRVNVPGDKEKDNRLLAGASSLHGDF